jgi:hypothetical protein
MFKFDRMEFPKKYPVSNWIKLVVLLLICSGLLIHNCWQNQIYNNIIIRDIKITDYSRVHVEVEYTIYNKSSIDRDIWLILNVTDNKDIDLGSALYSVRIKAGQTQSLLKIIDKLSRPLELNDKPAKATIEVYKRKGLL